MRGRGRVGGSEAFAWCVRVDDIYPFLSAFGGLLAAFAWKVFGAGGSSKKAHVKRPLQIAD